MGQHATWESKREEDNVLDCTVEITSAAGANRFGQLAEQVEGDGDIVRGDAPQGVDIGLDAAEIDAGRVQIIGLANGSFVEQGLDVAHRGYVLKYMPHHQHQSRPVCYLDQSCRLGHGHGEWFFDEDVFARLQRCAREGIMRARRRGDGDRLDITVQEMFEVVAEPGGAIEVAGFIQPVGVGVADGAEVCAGQSVEIAGEVGAPVAEADETDAGLSHCVLKTGTLRANSDTRMARLNNHK